jgi:hypothetical protein
VLKNVAKARLERRLCKQILWMGMCNLAAGSSAYALTSKIWQYKHYFYVHFNIYIIADWPHEPGRPQPRRLVAGYRRPAGFEHCSGHVDGQSGTAVTYLRILRFPLPVEWTQSHPNRTKKMNRKLQGPQILIEHPHRYSSDVYI